MILLKKIYRGNGMVKFMLDKAFKEKKFDSILFTSAPRKWQKQWIYDNDYEFNDKVPGYKFVASLLKDKDESLNDYTKDIMENTSEPIVSYKKRR